MNYRPMFTFSSTERCGNAQVFGTREEALNSARARFQVWTIPTGYDVDETTDPVNYHWTHAEGDVRLAEGASVTANIYENSCDDPACWCRAQSEWPDNIRDGCEWEAA